MNLTVTTLSSTNTTLAGVAQSVERVALINSKEINLKVVGSSPTFGYSYHIKLIRAAVLFVFWWEVGGFDFWSGKDFCGCRLAAVVGGRILLVGKLGLRDVGFGDLDAGLPQTQSPRPSMQHFCLPYGTV
jgi:hypothetical protein